MSFRKERKVKNVDQSKSIKKKNENIETVVELFKESERNQRNFFKELLETQRKLEAKGCAIFSKVRFFSKIPCFHLSAKLNPRKIFQEGLNHEIKYTRNQKSWSIAKLNPHEILSI